MIDVTGVNMVELVKKAYELSRPQGLGMLHFTPDPLTDEEAQSYIQEDRVFYLDYVKGRACKLGVVLKDGKLMMSTPWYDHSDLDLVKLLAHVGIEYVRGQENHGMACNCDICRQERGQKTYSPQQDYKDAMEAHKNGTAFRFHKLG